MNRKNGPRATSLALLGLSLALACGESREERLKRQQGYEAAGKDVKDEHGNPIPDVPPHPTREQLRPLLETLYGAPKLPDVMEADIVPPLPEYPYELTAGVLSVIRLQQGLSNEQKVRAIVLGTAEAEAWAYRSNARRTYSDLIHRVKRGFGDDQKEKVLKAYTDLKLLSFFNSPQASEAIAALPADVRGPVEQMKQEFTSGRDKYWAKWMDVKMYARRVVSGDEPFKPILRQISQALGQQEVKPRTWAESMDQPFAAWANEIVNNEKLITQLTNLRELREREEFLNDTHALWVMEGSSLVPPKAKNLKADKELGFAFHREDLGGGYNDLTFVFSNKLSGAALKRTFLQSILFWQLMSDFQMLATAGSDFMKKFEDGTYDPKTQGVPDALDPLYAKCGSQAAVDSLITGFRNEYPTLQGLTPSATDPTKILDRAHKCIIAGAAPHGIRIPAKTDEFDVEGPAPGSRLAVYQMLARFEKIDVNMAAMQDKRTQEDEVIDDAEAVLKRIKNEQNAGKGTK